MEAGRQRMMGIVEYLTSFNSLYPSVSTLLTTLPTHSNIHTIPNTPTMLQQHPSLQYQQIQQIQKQPLKQQPLLSSTQIYLVKPNLRQQRQQHRQHQQQTILFPSFSSLFHSSPHHQLVPLFHPFFKKQSQNFIQPTTS